MADQRAVDEAAVGRALDWAGMNDHPGATSPASIARVEEGVNDLFLVDGGHGDTGVVVKFATFSVPASFHAGVAAYRLLGATTALPVPAVHAFQPDPDRMPAFTILERLPGKPLAGGNDDPPSPAAVRTFGDVIARLGSIPVDKTDGFGRIHPADNTSQEFGVTAEYDDCAAMLCEYASELYGELPAHAELAQVAAGVPEFLRTHRSRLPSTPDPAVVVTDFSPKNLLTPNGEPPARADGPTGLVDLERARLGPIEFTAVNAEYLMTRHLDDPDLLVEALYEPLPFGPDVPARDLYRLVAMGRSVHALDLWYDAGSKPHDRRGRELAQEIKRIVA